MIPRQSEIVGKRKHTCTFSIRACTFSTKTEEVTSNLFRYPSLLDLGLCLVHLGIKEQDLDLEEPIWWSGRFHCPRTIIDHDINPSISNQHSQIRDMSRSACTSFPNHDHRSSWVAYRPKHHSTAIRRASQHSSLRRWSCYSSVLRPDEGTISTQGQTSLVNNLTEEIVHVVHKRPLSHRFGSLTLIWSRNWCGWN